VFPSAPTLVISPSEILRRKTIAANRGPGKLRFRRDAFTDSLCRHLAVRTRRFAKRPMKRVPSMLIMSKNRDVSTASIISRCRTLAVVTGANRG
jgi:hypothetical protein